MGYSMNSSKVKVLASEMILEVDMKMARLVSEWRVPQKWVNSKADLKIELIAETVLQLARSFLSWALWSYEQYD